MDLFRRFLQGVRVAPSDEELGRRSSVYPSEPRKSVPNPDEAPSAVLESSDKLMEFRMLIGITTHPSFKSPRGFSQSQRPMVTTAGRPAPNTGIYANVVDNEIRSKKNYKWFAVLINTCLGLQIVVAAALTALGASDGSRGAVTVFGAINTVIAGFLTWLKGSGLPNRLKYFQHEWAKVREYIEQRERDLSSPHNNINIHEEIATIRNMYEEIRADVEANQPDRFVSASTLRGPPIVAPGPALAGKSNEGSDALHSPDGRMSILVDGLRHAKEKMTGTHKELDDVEKQAEHYEGVISTELHRDRVRLSEDVSKLKSRMVEKMKEISHLEDEIESHGKRAVNQQVKEAELLAKERLKHVTDLEKSVEHQGQAAIAEKQNETIDKIEEIEDDAKRRAKEEMDPKTQLR